MRGIQLKDAKASLFLSAVNIAEIADGIAKARRAGARRKSAALSEWLETVLHLYGDRVLPFDAATAKIAGGLSDLARSRGQAPGSADIAIAATARRHGLTVLSRNARHFAAMDVPAVDPFEGCRLIGHPAPRVAKNARAQRARH